MLFEIFAIFLSLLGTLFLLLFFRETRRYFYYPRLHGPNPTPIFGKFEFLNFNINYQTYETLENMKKYPRIYMTKDLALVAYFVHDIQLIKEIGVKLKDEFLNHPDFFYDSPVITSRGLVNLKGAEWKARRKLVGPYFHGSRLHSLINPIFLKQTRIFFEKLSSIAVDEPIDVMQTMRDYSMDLIGEFAFGVDFESQEKSRVQFSKAVKDFIEAQVEITHYFFLPFWHYLPIEKIKAFQRSQQTLLLICQEIVDLRKLHNSKKESFYYIDSLIQSDLSCGDILAEAVITFLAGTETTAITLMWSIYHILRSREIRERVIEEIKENIGEDEINETNISKLKYLECVLKETLRFYPPNAVTTRENENAIVLDGHKFPPKTFFFIPIWALHHSEEFFENPEEFDPSRFEKPLSQKAKDAYMPFGFGERICMGNKFALIVSKVLLATMFQNFSFDLVNVPKEGLKWNANSSLVLPDSLFIVKKEKVD